MKPMSEEEYRWHNDFCLIVRQCVSALRLSHVEDEDIQVAKARLENWLAENDKRWVK